MTGPDTIPEFLTFSQAARLANLSGDGARYAARKGRLTPAARTASGHALFTLAEVQRWARERQRGRWPQRGGEAA